MKLYLLDLDRTAFKTDEHFADFCEVLKTEFGIDADVLKQHEHQLQAKPSPYSPIDDLRYSQIDVDEEKIKEVALAKLSSNQKNYLYEDVQDFINKVQANGDHVVLVTVGTHEYQQHKLKLCPALDHLPVLITREPKSKLLGEVMNLSDPNKVVFHAPDKILEASEVFLIDDRAGTFDNDMPVDSRFHPVRIVRQDAAYSDQPTPSGVRQISKLSEI